MKVNLVILLISVFLCSCEKQLEMEKIPMNNFVGKSEFFYFKNRNLGYSFNNIRFSEEMAENQLNDVNYFAKSNDFAIILKTENGGKNWKCIDTIKNFTFYNSYFVTDNNILIQVKSAKENLKNSLLKFTIRDEQTQILNYNFRRMGNIWEDKNLIFVNAKNKDNSSVFSIQNDFSKIDSTENNSVLKNQITKLNNDFYSLTWQNEIYNLTKNQKSKLPIETEYIIPIEQNNVLLFVNTKDSVKIYNFNLLSKKNELITEFVKYSIVKDLKKYGKNIVALIGNIEGVFTGYDIIYSIDNGKNWNIQKLPERSFVEPIWVNENEVLIYQGLDKLTKIKLTE